MNDIENQAYTRVRNKVTAKFPELDFSGEYVDSPSIFPHTSMYMTENMVYSRSEDSGAIENATEVIFQIDIYSNKSGTRKSECKKIAEAVDHEMQLLGFVREFMHPIPNLADNTIFRYSLRYRGIVDKNNYVYRR